MVRRKKLINKINDGNYEQEVILSAKPYILLLSAPFCDPNGVLEKTLEEVAEEYEDIVNAGTVDIIKQRELTEMFEISSAPTMVMMTGGVVDIRLSGMITKEQVIEVMELDKIRAYKQKGFNYHPPRNFIPGQEMNDGENEGEY